MAKRTLKGVDSTVEKNYKHDTKNKFQKFNEYIRSDSVIPFLWVIAFTPIFVPLSWPLAFITIAILCLVYVKNKTNLSFEIPKGHDHEVSERDDKGKLKKAAGISYFGNELDNQKEVWFNDSQLRTHALIFGTTGAGKTESLLSIASNSFMQGSGLVYVDGKADSTLWAKIYSTTAAFGRLDDLYILNYMKGDKNFDSPEENLMTNTLNPFAVGTPDSIAGLISSIAITGEADMWSNRASAFINALSTLTCHLRDRGEILLSAKTMRSFIDLGVLIECVNRRDIKTKYKEPMEVFLNSLPDFKYKIVNGSKIYNPPEKQGEKVGEQFGYISMQLTKAFSLFSDDFNHITSAEISEIDFYDIVVNRRILVVLIPALEKDPATVAILGRLVITSIKQLMATTLGAQVDGSVKEVIDKKPTTSRSPFTTIFDEYGYYAVQGAAVMPAQARSLGFSMIFAGQDFQAFKKGSPEEAASIVANCGIKMCMKLEDYSETYQIFKESAGKTTIVADNTIEKEDGAYKPDSRLSLQTVDIVDIRDLKAQTEGQAHLQFGDKLRRISVFYAAPKPLKNTRVNSFLEIRPPFRKEIDKINRGHNDLAEVFNKFSDPITGLSSLNEMEKNYIQMKKFDTSYLDNLINDINKIKSITEFSGKQINPIHCITAAIAKKLETERAYDNFVFDESLALANTDFKYEVSTVKIAEDIDSIDKVGFNNEDFEEVDDEEYEFENA